MNTDALDHHHAATDCPNCDAVVSGNFCHQCGQETVLHPASTREFVHEFIGHYVALEGKLWKSLGLLLFRPGRLTLEYIKGRRVRYVQPLRLYLTFSLIFFAVLKFNAHVGVGPQEKQAATATATAAVKDAVKEAQQDLEADGGQEQSSTPTAASAGTPTGTAPAVLKKNDDGKGRIIQEDDPEALRKGTESLRTRVAGVSPHAAEKMTEFIDLSRDDKERVLLGAFYGYAPYAIFFMMPVFALYLKVLYLGSGRRYGEHLLFALHTNGFAYLALTLWLLIPHGYGLGLLKGLLWLWIAFYLPAAMRHVYGGGRVITGLRWIVLMFFHLLTMMLAVFGGVLFGVLH